MVKHNLRYFMENANSIHMIITKSYSNEKPMMYIFGVLRSPLHGLPAQESHQAKAGLAHRLYIMWTGS